MRHQRISQEESYLCRCSTTFHVDQKTMKKNASLMLNSFLKMHEDLEQENDHLLVLVLRKSGPLSMLEFSESRHPIFRVTSPPSRSRLRSKNHEKLSIHFQADLEKIETIFRTITSVHQRSFYGAVAEMCEQCETFDDRTGKPLSWCKQVPHSCLV